MWPGYAGRKRNAALPGASDRRAGDGRCIHARRRPLAGLRFEGRNPGDVDRAFRDRQVASALQVLRDNWLTPRSRENTRAARRTLMRVGRTPPAGPFAKTDDTTL